MASGSIITGGRENPLNACGTTTDEHPATPTMVMLNFFQAGLVLLGNSLALRLFHTLAAATRRPFHLHTSRSLYTMLSLWHLIWIVYSPLPILAALVDVSIDDTQFTYQPAAAWNTRNAGAGCSGCTANPDATQFYDGTWHDGTVYEKYFV